MRDTLTPPARRPQAPATHRVAGTPSTSWEYPGASSLPVVAFAAPPEPDDLLSDLPAHDPASTRRPTGGTRRCPHCGPVVPGPYPGDHDDRAAPGDRCPACGYDWAAAFNQPGGAPCTG